jgi:hypothetical protein
LHEPNKMKPFHLSKNFGESVSNWVYWYKEPDSKIQLKYNKQNQLIGISLLDRKGCDLKSRFQIQNEHRKKGRLLMKTFLKRILIFFISVLSAGWIIPFYFSIKFILDWSRLELYPIVYGTKNIGSSFPFLSVSGDMLLIACIWLAIVILIWTIVLSKYILFSKKKNQ